MHAQIAIKNIQKHTMVVLVPRQIPQGTNIPIKLLQLGTVRTQVGHGVDTVRTPGGHMAVTWRLPGGYLAVTWRLPGGYLAVISGLGSDPAEARF